MARKRTEGSLTQDPARLAEVTYRFAFDAVHRPLPPDAHAARLRLESGNRAFAELLDGIASFQPATLSIDVDPNDVGLLPGRFFGKHDALASWNVRAPERYATLVVAPPFGMP